MEASASLLLHNREYFDDYALYAFPSFAKTLFITSLIQNLYNSKIRGKYIIFYVIITSLTRARQKLNKLIIKQTRTQTLIEYDIEASDFEKMLLSYDNDVLIN